MPTPHVDLPTLRSLPPASEFTFFHVLLRAQGKTQEGP